jgi:gluconolactonase
MRIRSIEIIMGAVLLCGVADAQAQEPFKLVALSPEFWELVDHDAKLTRVGTGFGFTEGPVWYPAGFLYVSDAEQNKIYRMYMDGCKEVLINLADPDGMVWFMPNLPLGHK